MSFPGNYNPDPPKKPSPTEQRVRNRDARSAALWVVIVIFFLACLALAFTLYGQPSGLATATHDSVEDDNPLTGGSAWYRTFSTWLINILGTHPWLVGVFLLAVLSTNMLRGAWPNRLTRPRVVAAILGGLDPIAGNFWHLAHVLAGKFGYDLSTPPGDDDCAAVECPMRKSGSGKLPDPNVVPKQ